MRIDAVSDGWVWTEGASCPACGTYFVDDVDLWLLPDYVALVKFQRPVGGAGAERAWLSLSFLSERTEPQDIKVHAFGSEVGGLAVQDLQAFLSRRDHPLGTLPVLEAAFGEEVFFDVSGFVGTAADPYLVFALSANNFAALGSLEVNNGHGVQLLLAAVPEPSEAALMFAGLLTLAGWLRRRAA